MNRVPQTDMLYQQKIAVANAAFMSRVYLWMMLGLLISGMVAYGISIYPPFMTTIVTHRGLFWVLVIAQLVAVMGLSAFINRLSLAITYFLYLAYALLSGTTLSVIFIIFTQASIAQAFFLTAFAFTGLSAFGFLTKRDLGPLGLFCLTGLFGLVGFWILGLIFPSILGNKASMIASICGVIIFAGLTAYDTQKIKSFNTGNLLENKKAAVYGALMLYLDFINLFLNLLYLFGRRR